VSDIPVQKTKGIVDLVFLIDATGSMAPCINALKNNIETFVASLTTKDANNATPVRDWRAKIVGYRDFDVDARPIEDHPFVNTVQALRGQLAGLHADGGDEPESLLEALYKVATMPSADKGAQARPDAWRNRTTAARVVVIFTDAPYKEPLAQPKGATLEDVFHVLTSNRIILSIFAPDMPCYQRLSEVDKAEWNVITGGSTPQESLERFTADQKNFATTLRQLARTISKTADVALL
jgi:hypothetical protein